MAQVLIVDDDEIFSRVLERVLNDAGHDVIKAANGAEGLEMAKASTPALIITDMNMPGMTGWQLVKSLRENSDTASIPIVGLTAHGTADDRTEAYEAGIAAYISKPLDAELVKSKIAKIIGN